MDKADSPPIPESYIYLLAVQCIVSLCEGFAAFIGPIYTSIVVQRPRTAGESIIRAPPALNVDKLPQDDKVTLQLRPVRDMVASGWPALLAALSFIISTNLSDELFGDVLASYQAMTNVSGMLGLTTPRDAFFTSLAKFAVPTKVVSSVDTVESPAPRTTSSLTDNLGLTGPPPPPGLSERNLACLKVFVSSALYLSGSLDESWFDILEVLQNADYVLTSKGGKPTISASRRSSIIPGSGALSRSVSSSTTTSPPTSTGNLPSSGTHHPLLTELDPENVQNTIQRLFDTSKNLEDDAFRHFVNALCKLSSEMVVMQSGEPGIPETPTSTQSEDAGSLGAALSPSPRTSAAHRRRVSGIHIPRTLVSSLLLIHFVILTTGLSDPVTSGSTSWEGSPFLTSTALSTVQRTLPGTLSRPISFLSFGIRPHLSRSGSRLHVS